MVKTLRAVNVYGTYRLAELDMSPSGRSAYAYRTNSSPNLTWVRILQDPTSNLSVQSYSPLPSDAGSGTGWSADGKYHLFCSATISIYLYTGNAAAMVRIFNDTPENVFGETFYPKIISWFNDDYYFWIS